MSLGRRPLVLDLKKIRTFFVDNFDKDYKVMNKISNNKKN